MIIENNLHPKKHTLNCEFFQGKIFPQINEKGKLKRISVTTNLC